MQPADRRGRMSEWTVAFGLGLKLTRDYFGARDGKQRTEPAPAPAAGGAEVVDLARAVLGDSPSALTAGAIAAASGTRPAPATATATAPQANSQLRPVEVLHA